MAKPARAKPSNKRKRNPWVRALKWTIGIFLTLGVLGAAGVAGQLLARSAIVVMAATSTGLFHQIAEYIAAVAFSDANWDAPPGSGYFTVAMGLLAAFATMLFWWLDSRANRIPSASPTSAAPAIG